MLVVGGLIDTYEIAKRNYKFGVNALVTGSGLEKGKYEDFTGIARAAQGEIKKERKIDLLSLC